jgi:hypothetical protein
MADDPGRERHTTAFLTLGGGKPLLPEVFIKLMNSVKLFSLKGIKVQGGRI